jgi:thiol:disulfide interchange protein
MKSFQNRAVLILFIAALLSLAQPAKAQNPVSLSMAVKSSKVVPGGRFTAHISASISGNWHMYSVTQGAGGPIPTRITVVEGGSFKAAGAPSGSAPKREMDANFGIMTEFYVGNVSFSLPVQVDAAAQPGTQPLTINVRYQVCNDTTCLPPKSVKVSALVEIVGSAGTTAALPSPSVSVTPSPTPKNTANSNTNSAAGINANSGSNNQNTNSGTNVNSVIAEETNRQPAENLAGSSSNVSSSEPQETTIGSDKILSTAEDDPWSFIWLAITVGALSLLTPCVFPMIPIAVSYFTNHSAGSRSTAVKLASVFSLGIIATFTLLGMMLAIFVGAAGVNLFAANPRINLLIAGIFLLFAFNLFGAYEINVPSGILTRLDSLTRSTEGEGRAIIGALLMGLTFTLTSFTCTSPFVGTILVSVSNGDWQAPFLGMLAFSSVFALPFFVLALVPQWVSTLPRAGGWMNSVKVAMGFLEVAAAMKFISNVDLVWKWGIFTREVVLAIWIAIGATLSMYLLGKFQLFHDSKLERIGSLRLSSAVASLAISFYLLTGLFGARLGELESFLPPMSESSVVSAKNINGEGKSDGELRWLKNDYKAALDQAKRENKPVLIDFTGYTCTNCRWMEANMFPKALVQRELEKYVLVQLYTDGEGEPYQSFQQMQQDKFKTVALPFYAVVDAKGDEIKTFPGLTRNEAQFVSFLQAGHEGY